METETIAIRTGKVYPWQSDLWQTLTRRLADQTLAHAYLLTGAEGIGKGDFALAFASYLLCQQPGPTLCGQCKGCQLVASGNHPDLLDVHPEETSRIIKVDQVRAIGRFAQQTAHSFANRVVILSPAEALNAASANSLLKVLEEPPPNTFFLLLSHQPGLLMPTIRSRCQIERMPVPDADAALDWLRGAAPESTAEDIGDALILAGNRPLAARTALAHDLPAQRSDLLSALAQVLKSQRLPIELAKQYDKADRVAVLTLLLSALWHLLRFAATTHAQYLFDPPLRELASAAGLGENSPGRRRDLLKLVALTSEAIRQLESGSNPNPQLILENCLIQWHSLLGEQ